MDKSNLILSVFFIFLCLLQASFAQICSAPSDVTISENNKINHSLAVITVMEGVTPKLAAGSEKEFSLIMNGTSYVLVAAKAFDYETSRSHQARITCTQSSGAMVTISIIVIIKNLNDNPPNFGRSIFQVNVTEMTPVGSSVGRFNATDPDQPPELFYTLTSESSAFKLRSPTDPELLMNTLLDYDKVQNITLVLYVQDTMPKARDDDSLTATATIVITVIDVDNRPPWFQPCVKHQLGVAVVCHREEYTSRVTVGQQVPMELTLTPHLYAIDGDSGLNEEITYSFLRGNDTDHYFEIDATTGKITLVKTVQNLETFNLKVLAAQKNNMNQFATTTVRVSIIEVSKHNLTFEKEPYRGVVSTVGSMAVTEQGPLLFSVQDQDYPEGVNPYVTLTIKGSSDFVVINGYLFLNNPLPDGEVSMELVATDTVNGDTIKTEVLVVVRSAGSVVSKVGSEDMAALGVSLAILLLICLVIIGVLIFRMKKEKDDWKKIYNVNVFRSSLGQSPDGNKEGIQYTNKVFQSSEDEETVDTGHPHLESEKAHKKEVNQTPLSEAAVKSPPVMPPVEPDYVNQTDVDKADNEKEVKSILTRDKRMDEGYKAVWFKEDIDPNAKDEVVIIPDIEEENNSQADKTSERDSDNTDMDSGLGVKMEDSSDNTDNEEEFTNDL